MTEQKEYSTMTPSIGMISHVRLKTALECRLRENIALDISMSPE
jgi:hypothetical protein